MSLLIIDRDMCNERKHSNGVITLPPPTPCVDPCDFLKIVVPNIFHFDFDTFQCQFPFSFPSKRNDNIEPWGVNYWRHFSRMFVSRTGRIFEGRMYFFLIFCGRTTLRGSKVSFILMAICLHIGLIINSTKADLFDILLNDWYFRNWLNWVSRAKIVMPASYIHIYVGWHCRTWALFSWGGHFGCSRNVAEQGRKATSAQRYVELEIAHLGIYQFC